ncbi:hypothetical protein [uncultured Aquitalea sp.]|uniref:hypothetical protein n=1 Tax=uncultured Aquitalea sp. TaxID=540272 RepID=UPI0025D873C4|nr:hypothetical protein [uncultured Aquitalea sp.]
MALRDLVTGADGKLSHSKLWPNVASAAATVMFCWKGWKGTDTYDIWLVYLACVGGYSAIVQGIAAFKKPAPAADSQ